jgi:phosphohistidine phosphatase SixA
MEGEAMNETTHGIRQYSRWIVRVAVIIVTVAVCWYWYFCWYPPATTVFLVRHADKAENGSDDLHVPLGFNRADELVHVLGEAEINDIFHSNTVRARKTAEPLAAHLSLTTHEYPALDTQTLVNTIRTDHAGERVFVVGHSNTVPELITKLGGASIPNIAESDYDNLFVVTQCRCRWSSPTVIRMKYGLPTPP